MATGAPLFLSKSVILFKAPADVEEAEEEAREQSDNDGQDKHNDDDDDDDDDEEDDMVNEIGDNETLFQNVIFFFIIFNEIISILLLTSL